MPEKKDEWSLGNTATANVVGQSPTVTTGNWADSQSCGCWPSKGQVCMAHAGYVTPESLGTRPYCCPVCGGKGKVSNGFYGAVGVDTWSTSSLVPDSCRSCSGTGIVWGG